MSALAGFLKGKIDESLTKLVQPAGLIPATLLVLLNLAFIYPGLKDEVGFLGSFAGLDPVWQVVAVATVILSLGYLILSASSVVLDLLAGESWRGTWLYNDLRKRRQDALVRGELTLAPPESDEFYLGDDLNRMWELRASYPITAFAAEDASDEAKRQLVRDVGPTALGNVLYASRRLIFDRWGIDPTALWPQMEAVVPKDAPARATVADAKASLDTLANVASVFAVFAVEGLVLYSSRGTWSAALLSALALPAAYVAYRTAVSRARGYGDAMEVAFDLYRDELGKELQLAEHKSVEEERALWKKASQLFLWGYEAVEKPDEVFEAQPAPAPTPATVTASRNLRVVRHREEAFDVPATGDEVGPRRGRYVEYEFVVTRDPDRPADGFVAVSDKRIPRIAAVPEARVLPKQAIDPKGEIETPAVGAPNTLVWQLRGVAPGESLWLAFALPIWEFVVSSELVISEFKQRDERLSFDLSVTAPAGVPTQPWLDVYVAATNRRPLLLIQQPDRPDKRPPELQGARYHFDLAGLGFPATLRMSFPRRSE